MDKRDLGQFYTTNYKYIFKNFKIPKIDTIIEPFAGKGDLLNFVPPGIKIECFDIDPKKNFIIKRDTLLDPPSFNNKFVITNPPYLARNKTKNKTIFDKYGQNDLYKCFLMNIISDTCIGGIIIIPLNFWCSIRTNDIHLRKSFLRVYNVLVLNVFEENVFDDTSYAVCSFQFEKRINDNDITCFVHPGTKKFTFNLSENNNYTVGGEIYNLKQNRNIKIRRITRKNKDTPFKTNILLKCIDDSSKISLSYIDNGDIYIDDTRNMSARSYALLSIEPILNKRLQMDLVKKFNEYLTTKRKVYNSLFLTNYREGNRKRISFKLSYEIINFILL